METLLENIKKMEDLAYKLKRQIEFGDKFGFQAHDIQSYSLKPMGRNEEGYILYHTEVILKDGQTHYVKDNVRKFLHPKTWRERR